MIRWLWVLLLLLIASCATLRDDPSMSATDANFPTAEAVVRGERFRGLKIVSVKRGEPLADLGIKIQTIFSGTVRIDSANCQIAQSFRYERSELVELPITGNADQSCVINFTVLPEYPKQKEQGLVIYGFKGSLAIRVLNPEDVWFGKTFVLTQSEDAKLEIPTKETKPVQVAIFGCGKKFNEFVNQNPDGSLSIPVSQFVSIDTKSCVASGIALSQDSPDIVFDIYVVRYSGLFVDLPKPQVTFKNNEVCLSAEPTVSFLMTDTQDSNSTRKCFKGAQLIRGITVKGRSFIGLIKDGAVEWL